MSDAIRTATCPLCGDDLTGRLDALEQELEQPRAAIYWSPGDIERVLIEECASVMLDARLEYPDDWMERCERHRRDGQIEVLRSLCVRLGLNRERVADDARALAEQRLSASAP